MKLSIDKELADKFKVRLNSSFTMCIDSYMYGNSPPTVENVYLLKEDKVYMVTTEIEPYGDSPDKEEIISIRVVEDKELLAIYQTFENLEVQKCELETAAQERAEELKLI